MSLYPISESDDFVVHYDPMKGMYRVTVFNDGHFWDEYWFDAYEDKEINSEYALSLYWRGFIRGAAELIEYMRKNYRNGIFPSEMTDILKEFCSQYGDLIELERRDDY